MACNMLATQYLRAGRVADALAQLEEALRLDPQNAEVHSNLGVVLQAQGRLAEGMEHLRTAVQLKPKDDPPTDCRGESTPRLGPRRRPCA